MIPALPQRHVTLVLVDRDGNLLGQLPPFAVDTPWWQDLAPVLAARPDVVILRLLQALPDRDHVMGGEVSYLAEVASPPARVERFTGDPALLEDHPLRMPWARPGGPAADLAWAEEHIRATGPAEQMRSWNLSSIWRLPTRDGAVWLKCVPPFFRHEAAVLQLFGPQTTLPRLIAAEGSRMLLHEMPGVDGYEASSREGRQIVDALIALQLGAAGRLAEFAALAPDWRAAPLRGMAAELVDRHRASALAPLVEGWDARWSAIEACGLPDTLFHGDPHPGNARIGTDPPVLFDWGDSGIGHPLFDLTTVKSYGVDGSIAGHWLAGWAAAVPGSDPSRAWELIEAIATFRGALVFQRFLDNIEPSERVYHARDVEPFLRQAEAALRAERDAG